MQDIAKTWHDKWINTIKPLADSPLLLSGGVDSATILAALLELGKRPACYTFTLGDNLTTDAAVAQSMARAFDLPFTLIRIPQREDVLIADVRRLINILKDSRKTAIQCAHFLLYVAPEVVKDGHSNILCGTGGIVSDGRKVAVLVHQQGEDVARKYREDLLTDTGSLNGTQGMKMVARHHGLTLIEPYKVKAWAKYSISLDVKTINTPVQKGIALQAFPDFWRRGKWYRTNAPLQLGSGVARWHDTLIQTSLNKGGYKSVVGIYNAILRGEV